MPQLGLGAPLPVFLSNERQPNPRRHDRGGGITHGQQLIGGETSLVGYTAYTDPTLGRKLVAGDLTRTTGFHWISDFTGGTGGTAGNPKIVYAMDLDQVAWDVDYVTLRACNIRQNTSAYLNGTHHRGAFLDYVTFASTVSDGTQCMQYESWSANRCLFKGYTDGAKTNGGVDPIVVTECISYVLAQDAGDHNDNYQNVGGNGTVNFVRCLMYQDPVGSPGQGSSIVQSGDMTVASTFFMGFDSCMFFGGSNGTHPSIRLYDGGLTTNITYSVANCIWDHTAADAPYDRGSSNTTPTGQIAWSNNRYDDGTTIALV